MNPITNNPNSNSKLIKQLDLLKNNLRSKSRNFVKAKKDWEDVVDGNKREKNNNKVAEVDRTASSISRILSYFDTSMPSAQTALCEDVINVNYNIYCDLNRVCVPGSSVYGLNTQFEWTKCDVSVSLKPGFLSEVVLDPAVQLAVKGNTKSLKKLGECCGFRGDEMKQLKPEDIDKLLNTIGMATLGQNKLTRLVKGYLIYRDLLNMEKKRAEFSFHPNAVCYGVDGILNAAKSNGNAYVWCDAPSSDAYAAALYCMCEEYPNPKIKTNSNVTIPSDGKNVYIVSRGVITKSTNIILTADVMWSSILKYCNVMGLAHVLDEVAMIACSLSENRYLTNVTLPRVASAVDLVYPATVKTETLGFKQKPYLNEYTMKCVGRTHQLMCFVVLKDIITSALNTTADGINPFTIVKSYLMSQSFNYNKYTSVSNITNVLHITRSFDFLQNLSENDVCDINGTSIFEGLWVVDKMHDIMHKGVIGNMKAGTKNRLRGGSSNIYTRQDHMSGLRNEMELALLDSNDLDICEGDWSIKVTSLEGAPRELEQLKFHKVKTNYARTLATVDVVGPAKVQFGSKNAATRRKFANSGTVTVSKIGSIVSKQTPTKKIDKQIKVEIGGTSHVFNSVSDALVFSRNSQTKTEDNRQIERLASDHVIRQIDKETNREIADDKSECSVTSSEELITTNTFERKESRDDVEDNVISTESLEKIVENTSSLIDNIKNSQALLKEEVENVKSDKIVFSGQRHTFTRKSLLPDIEIPNVVKENGFDIKYADVEFIRTLLKRYDDGKEYYALNEGNLGDLVSSDVWYRLHVHNEHRTEEIRIHMADRGIKPQDMDEVSDVVKLAYYKKDYEGPFMQLAPHYKFLKNNKFFHRYLYKTEVGFPDWRTPLMIDLLNANKGDFREVGLMLELMGDKPIHTRFQKCMNIAGLARKVKKFREFWNVNHNSIVPKSKYTNSFSRASEFGEQDKFVIMLAWFNKRLPCAFKVFRPLRDEFILKDSATVVLGYRDPPITVDGRLIDE